MQFNLNVVIQDIEEVESLSSKAAIKEFHTLLQSVGHKVTKATLTSDKGQTDVTPPAAEETPVEAPVALQVHPRRLKER